VNPLITRFIQIICDENGAIQMGTKTFSERRETAPWGWMRVQERVLQGVECLELAFKPSKL